MKLKTPTMQNTSAASVAWSLIGCIVGGFLFWGISMKTCIKCGKSLSEDNFYKNKRQKDGLMNNCKPCQIQYNVIWRAANPEKKRKHDAKGRVVHREKRLAHSKKYYAIHRREILENRAKYRVEHGEEMRKRSVENHIRHRAKRLKYNAKYRLTHQAEHLQYALKRRYKEKLNKGKSYCDWARKLRSKKTFVCYWCGQRKPVRLLHIDHIVPISKGGADCISNVVPSCAYCNLSKKAKDLNLWAASVGMLAI